MHVRESTQAVVDGPTFKNAMVGLAAPVTVVTARDGRGDIYGFTASSVTSASLDPPLVLVGISRTSSCYAAMAGAAEFVVNVLGEQHRQVARRFATPGVDRFDGVETVGWDGAAGGPPCLADAGTLLRCALSDLLSVGDHSLLVGTVVDVRAGRTGRPLVWYQREFHVPAPATAP